MNLKHLEVLYVFRLRRFHRNARKDTKIVSTLIEDLEAHYAEPPECDRA